MIWRQKTPFRMILYFGISKDFKCNSCHVTVKLTEYARNIGQYAMDCYDAHVGVDVLKFRNVRYKRRDGTRQSLRLVTGFQCLVDGCRSNIPKFRVEELCSVRAWVLLHCYCKFHLDKVYGFDSPMEYMAFRQASLPPSSRLQRHIDHPDETFQVSVSYRQCLVPASFEASDFDWSSVDLTDRDSLRYVLSSTRYARKVDMTVAVTLNDYDITVDVELDGGQHREEYHVVHKLTTVKGRSGKQERDMTVTATSDVLKMTTLMEFNKYLINEFEGEKVTLVDVHCPKTLEKVPSLTIDVPNGAFGLILGSSDITMLTNGLVCTFDELMYYLVLDWLKGHRPVNCVYISNTYFFSPHQRSV